MGIEFLMSIFLISIKKKPKSHYSHFSVSFVAMLDRLFSSVEDNIVFESAKEKINRKAT